MADHTSAAFDEDLRELSSRLAEMGGLAERLLAESVRALVKRDTDLAQRVIASDVQIDLLLREIEEKAVLTIARRQPMAVDLREIIATLRISNDLERVGDLAKNTAKRVLALDGEYQAPRLLRGVEHMSEMVLAQLKEVLDAYGARDEKRAVAVWTRDGEVDAMYTSLFRELLTYMMEDPRHITLCTHLLFCAKNIERIGDHATNIAETVYYLVVGEQLADERPKSGYHEHHHHRVSAERRSVNVVQPIAMKPRILIVEDEEPLALLLRYNLENEGYSVDTVGRGEEAELKLRENLPDLVILDWMLPGTSGIEICRRLRARQGSDKVPILMLTARGEESERVRGLATGADDYVVKPFSVPELIARVNALLRRAKPGAISSMLKAGDLELDREKRRVHRSGRELALGPTEFRLLEFLMSSPGRVFSREQLLDGVWGREIYVDERTVDVHVGRLRKAINRGRERDPIRTVRGSGYSFDERYVAG